MHDVFFFFHHGLWGGVLSLAGFFQGFEIAVYYYYCACQKSDGGGEGCVRLLEGCVRGPCKGVSERPKKVYRSAFIPPRKRRLREKSKSF